jgi:CRP-like cAMP-binding protein
MIDVHLQKLRRRIEISSEEELTIRSAVTETRTIPADEILVRGGEELNSSVMLLDGWLARRKNLPGGEQQVIGLHIAGDFADLHGFTLKRLDHDVVTLCNCTIGIVPHERLHDITERHPRLARAYWLTTNVDAAMHRELALSLGQRPAISRMAHLFCELYLRLDVVGRARPDGYEFPLTQRELAQCLGLTLVHANRTVQELRRRRLIELESRQLTILDRSGLEDVAEFDPAYLYLDRLAV